MHHATYKVFTKASCVALLALLCYEHITSYIGDAIVLVFTCSPAQSDYTS